MGMFRSIYQAVTHWLTAEPEDKGHPMSDFSKLRREIRSCDVILVEGRSRVADVIGTITQSRWTHAALYIGRLHDVENPVLRMKIREYYDGQPDVQLLIESELGIGTVIRPLDTYKDRHMRICRPRELSYEDSQLVLKYAIHRLGTDYDVRQILDLGRFYLPWSILPRRARSSLFQWHPGGGTHTVCSTMLAEAFGAISFPILPLVKRQEGGDVQLFQRNPKLCTPSDFDYSPYFDIIKYPYMDFEGASSPSYRLMPWKGKASLSPDEAMLYTEAQLQQTMPPGSDTPPRRIDAKERL